MFGSEEQSETPGPQPSFCKLHFTRIPNDLDLSAICHRRKYTSYYNYSSTINKYSCTLIQLSKAFCKVINFNLRLKPNTKLFQNYSYIHFLSIQKLSPKWTKLNWQSDMGNINLKKQRPFLGNKPVKECIKPLPLAFCDYQF